MYCVRHIEENVHRHRHLTEKGMSQKDKNKVLQLPQCSTSDVLDDQHEALAAV